MNFNNQFNMTLTRRDALRLGLAATAFTLTALPGSAWAELPISACTA